MKFNNPLQLQGPQPGRLTNLGQFAFVNASTITRNVNVNAAYTAFLIVVNMSAGTKLWAAKVQGSPVGNAPWSYRGAFSFKQNFGGQVVLGSAANPGDTLAFSVYFGAVSSGNFTVYGLTNYAPDNIRPDGINYPLGALFVSSFTGAGANTIIAAPGPGFSILLAKGNFHTSTATGGPLATIAGVNGGLCETVQATFLELPIPECGILLDNNTQVSLQGSAGTTAAAIFYDIVPSA